MILSTDYLRQFCHRRILIIFFFGFSSGLPFALTASTLQAWLTVTGVNIVAIGLFSLVGQPYIYKFFWAPLLDRYIPPLLGRRAGWILVLQWGLVISIILMAYVKPNINPLLMASFALLTAFLSASQDIVINAYTTDILQPNERGMGAAMTVVGWRLAFLFSGAITLVLAKEIGWRETYLIMSGCMLVTSIVTFFAPEPKETAPPLSLVAAIVEPIKNFLMREGAYWLLFFIVIYKIGEAMTVALSTTFLLRAVHFTLIDVATVNKFGALVATIVGSILGGLLMPRLKLFKSLLFFGGLQLLATLLYMWLAIVGKNYLLMVIAIISENFFAGMSAVALVALMMALCDHRYTATQYAALSAIAAIARVFVGPLAGHLVNSFGWAYFYWWSFIFGLPGILILFYLQKRFNLDGLTEENS